MARLTLTSEQLKALIRVLGDDIVQAHWHWRMFLAIREALWQHPLVAAQSGTFWGLTLQAHIDACVLRLTRIFDQQSDSLHLVQFLQLIQINLDLFNRKEFRKRLATNPFVGSLAQTARKPAAKTLSSNIKHCSKRDALVRRLIIIRNVVVAHRGLTTTLSGQAAPAGSLDARDVEKLLERAQVVFNRYTRLFDASVQSTMMVGENDFGYIFKSVQAAVERSRAESQKL